MRPQTWLCCSANLATDPCSGNAIKRVHDNLRSRVRATTARAVDFGAQGKDPRPSRLRALNALETAPQRDSQPTATAGEQVAKSLPLHRKGTRTILERLGTSVLLTSANQAERKPSWAVGLGKLEAMRKRTCLNQVKGSIPLHSLSYRKKKSADELGLHLI